MHLVSSKMSNTYICRRGGVGQQAAAGLRRPGRARRQQRHSNIGAQPVEPAAVGGCDWRSGVYVCWASSWLILPVAVFLEIHKDPVQMCLPCAGVLTHVLTCGLQSSGKSSVLEAVVGTDFLPRGAGASCPLGARMSTPILFQPLPAHTHTVPYIYAAAAVHVVSIRPMQ